MTLEPNKPFESSRPAIVVDAGLRPGDYRFQLIVVNDQGQRSLPVEVVVTIEPSGIIIR